ncbi:MATE family efflux transporter [Eisenbergiella sp.]
MAERLFSEKSLKTMIIPLVIEQALVMLVGMADTVMVSYAGEAAISGVSLVDMINYLFITVFAAIATGGAVVVSQYLGNKDRENANQSAGQLFTAAGALSLVITVLCLIFHRGILRLLFGTIETDVMEAAVLYFVITTLSFPFLGLYNAGAALFRSMGKTSVTMYVSLMMNLINVVGNAVGIFVFHAGVTGVAVPTLLSRIAAAVAMTALAWRPGQEISVSGKNVFCFRSKIIRKILYVAVPGGVENGLFALGKVLVVSIVALFGTTQIAANGVANSIDSVAIIVVNAVNLAMVTVVGQCVGAGEYGQAEYYTKKLMRLSYISTAAFGAVICAALPILRHFYDLSAETWRLSCILVVMHNILAALLHPTSFNLSNTLRAAGDVKYTLYTGILSMLIFRLGSAVLFGIVLKLGIIGVWIAMGMDWLARSVFFMYRYRSGKWKAYRVI